MLKIKKNGTKLGRLGRLLFCLTISAAAIIIFSLIASLAVSVFDYTTKYIGLFSLVAMLLAASATGFLISRIFNDDGMLIPSLASLSVVLIMLLVNVILSAGKVSGGAFMNYGCYFGAYNLFAFLGKQRSMKRHRKNRP